MPDFRHRFREIKRVNKERLAKTIQQLLGVTVSVAIRN